jgi:hypothetical protein
LQDGQPACAVETHVCVKCVTNMHCRDAQKPICIDRDCEECRTDADCPADEPVCNDNQCKN